MLLKILQFFHKKQANNVYRALSETLYNLEIRNKWNVWANFLPVFRSETIHSDKILLLESAEFWNKTS